MIVIIALAILLIGTEYSGKNNFFDDNFTIAQTRALKGVFAIYVVFHHLCTYVADYFPSFFAFKYVGFLMVGGFFMISGYGLMYGLLHKQNYLKGFFENRLLLILIPYYIINVFYLIANRISGGLTIKYAVLSVFGFNLWYVMAIIILYIGFYLCFKFCSQKTGVVLISIFTIAYILTMFVLYKYANITALGFWWYNSVICFLVGIWYCYLKSGIDKLFKKYYLALIALCLIVIVPAYYYTTRHFNEAITILLPVEIICAFAFSILVLLITLKFRFGNKFLNICGDLSLELYLSHALFIFAYRSNVIVFGKNLYISNNLLYLILIIISTFVFSYMVHFISKLILKPIKKA